MIVRTMTLCVGVIYSFVSMLIHSKFVFFWTNDCASARFL